MFYFFHSFFLPFLWFFLITPTFEFFSFLPTVKLFLSTAILVPLLDCFLTASSCSLPPVGFLFSQSSSSYICCTYPSFPVTRLSLYCLLFLLLLSSYWLSYFRFSVFVFLCFPFPFFPGALPVLLTLMAHFCWHSFLLLLSSTFLLNQLLLIFIIYRLLILPFSGAYCYFATLALLFGLVVMIMTLYSFVCFYFTTD